MDEMIEQVAPTNVSLDDLEELINSLSPDEVAELAECDPDDSSMPPYMRCAYRSDLSVMFYRVLTLLEKGYFKDLLNQHLIICPHAHISLPWAAWVACPRTIVFCQLV